MRFYAGGLRASSLATTVVVAALACVVSLYTLPSAAPPVRPARQGSCFRFAKLGDNRLCSDNGTTTAIINATLHSSRSRNITIEISACGTLVRVGQSLSPSLGSSIINAGGRTVTKGLVDSHLHLITGGRTLSESRSFVNLSNVSTISHLKAAIAHATPEYGWIRAHSLPGTHTLQSLPDRDELDAAVNSVEIAVLIETEDQHSAIANTEALRQGNLTSSSSSPQGGTVETDAAGVPNGVLRDNAIAPVRSAALAHSSNESRYHAIEAALELIVSHGVTTVGDMQDIDALAAGDSGRIWSDVLLLRQLANSGRLRARVASFLPESVFSEHPGGEHELRQEHSSSSMHSITGVGEEFVDGSLGSWTALLNDPYCSDGNCDVDATNRGLCVSSPGQIDRFAAAASDPCTTSSEGGALALHAIGDRAVSDAISAAHRWKRQHMMFRIEHATTLQQPARIEAKRFASSRAIASIQGYEAQGCALFGHERLGEHRFNACAPHKTLAEAGAVLAMSSDWPVSPVDAIGNLQSAVFRSEPDTGKTAALSEALTAQDALHAYTAGSWQALGVSGVDDGLVEGDTADLVVWKTGCDPGTTDMLRHCSHTAFKTFVAGNCVHGCT